MVGIIVVMSRYFNKGSRDEYNESWRCATAMLPVANHHGGITWLWLGGQNAANMVDYLGRNGITRRQSCKESWGCKKASGIGDLQPFRVDDILDKGRAPTRDDWMALQRVIIGLDNVLRNEGLTCLCFCKQGARRSAFMVGAFIMCKTDARAKAVYEYLVRLRAIVEDVVETDLIAFESGCPAFRGWIENKVALPAVALQSEVHKLVARLTKDPSLSSSSSLARRRASVTNANVWQSQTPVTSDEPTRQRSRSRQRIRELQSLTPQETHAMYGIGSALVLSMGWQPGQPLGRLRQQNNILNPLTNDRPAGDRSGLRQRSQDIARQVNDNLQRNGDGAPDVCTYCAQPLDNDCEIVEYACSHVFHVHCHDTCVQTCSEDRRPHRCPLCRRDIVIAFRGFPHTRRHRSEPVERRPGTPAYPASGVEVPSAPSYDCTSASGTPTTWSKLQIRARLPYHTQFLAPNVESLAVGWVQSFLRQRLAWGDPACCLEEAFPSLSVTRDRHAGFMVSGELAPCWKWNDPEGEVAYHGSLMTAVFSVLVNGLKANPGTKKKASNGDYLSGVFCHKHGTLSKARGYMRYFTFPGGFIAAPLFQCRVANPPIRRTCPPDQWCLPEDGVQVTHVHFHPVANEDVQPEQFWIVGSWHADLEANPTNFSNA